MIKVYTKDGRYFKFDEFDLDKQVGTVKLYKGRSSEMYFFNDSITAIEYIVEESTDYKVRYGENEQ